MSIFLVSTLLFSILSCSQNKQTASAAATNPQPPPPPNLTLELRQANQLLAQRKCTEAAQGYQRFLDKYPKDAGTLNLLGLAYLCDSKTDLAIETFKRALFISPLYTDVHNNLGVAYMEQKNYTEARNEFIKTLQDANYPATGPYFNLAKLAFEQASYEESRALAKKVLDLSGNSKSPGPLLIYGLSLERLGRFDEAMAAYRDVVKIAPQNIEGCYYLANQLLQKGVPCEAREYYRKVVDIDPLSDLAQKAIEALKTINCPN